MVARIPNLELLLYKAQQALAHDPDFVQKIAEIKENESRKKSTSISVLSASRRFGVAPVPGSM